MKRSSFTVFDTAVSGDIVARLCSLSRSRTFVGTRTALYLISDGPHKALLVAGSFSSLTSSFSSSSSSPHNQISRSSACGLHRTVRTKPASFRLM